MADPLWSARALASLTAQDDYLRPLNPAAADAVLSEVERLAALIVEFPHMAAASTAPVCATTSPGVFGTG